MFDSQIITVLTKQLDAAALTQRVIANNVANVNTPGFKKSTVSFQEELRRAVNSRSAPLITTDPRHMGGAMDIRDVVPRVVEERDTTMTYGQNNVDIDQEMVNNAANDILYEFSADRLNGKFSLLGYVVRGGR